VVDVAASDVNWPSAVVVAMSAVVVSIEVADELPVVTDVDALKALPMF
jgi:hypothetical protein